MTRMPLSALPKAAVAAMTALDQSSHGALDRTLIELVKLRASQLNGCAFCIDMHAKEARHIGETDQRMLGLDAWREAPYYSARERAALEWTEAVTQLNPAGVPDHAWEAVRAQFEPEQIAALTVTIISINGWNRWNVAMRTPAGGYEVGMFG